MPTSLFAAAAEVRDYPPFAPADGRAQWLKVLLVLGIVGAGLSILSGLLQYDLLSRAAEGLITEEEAESNDRRELILALVMLPIAITTVVVFLMWVHRIYRNLPALGATNLTFTPGWVVGWHFVPIFNLFRPRQAMRENWHGSNPDGVDVDSEQYPGLVNWWWGLFLLSSFLGNVAARLSFSAADTIDRLQTVTMTHIVSNVADIPSACVAFWLVDRLTSWQSERFRRRAEAARAATPGAEPLAGAEYVR